MHFDFNQSAWTRKNMKRIFLLITVLSLNTSIVYSQRRLADSTLWNAEWTGGLWNSNLTNFSSIPSDYVQYLSRVGAQWVSLTVTLRINNSVDSTVERLSSHSGGPTFDDTTLVATIQQFTSRGYKVALQIALEEPWGVAPFVYTGKPAWRYEIGQQDLPTGYTLAEWKWNPSHVDHQSFVNKFWSTYTENVVHYANLIQPLGVKLFCIGTETDALFRTRSSSTSGYNYNYLTYIQALVDTVHKLYDGPVTYDQHSDATVNAVKSSYPDDGLKYLWSDAAFDVVGVSAYFAIPTAIPSSSSSPTLYSTIVTNWKTMFTNTLIRLRDANPKRQIVFTEFGYVNGLDPTESSEFQTIAYWDRNSNGIEDGQDQQFNVFDVFFRVADSINAIAAAANKPKVISKVFMSGSEASSNQQHYGMISQIRTFDTRGKQAERVRVKEKLLASNATFAAGNQKPSFVTRPESTVKMTLDQVNGQTTVSRNFTFSVVDPDSAAGDRVVLTQSSTPFGYFGFDSDGNIYGIPTGGAYQVRLTATDAFGLFDTVSFSLKVNRRPQAPSNNSDGMQEINFNGANVTSGSTISSAGTIKFGMNAFYDEDQDSLFYFLRLRGNGLDMLLPANSYTRQDSLSFGAKRSKNVYQGNLYSYLVSGTTYTLSGVCTDRYDTTAASGTRTFTVSVGGGVLPVELQSLTANVNNKTVSLQWTTATETNNYGFEVERTASPILTPSGGGSWTRIGFVEGSGTTNAPKSYSFVDNSANGKISYRLKQIDRDGNFEYSQEIEVSADFVPKEFALEQNYPNPFNPTTAIGYQLSAFGFTTLKIYDAIGREVATLVNEVKEAGTYSVQFDGSRLSSGVYFCRMSAAAFTSVTKMTILK